MPDPAQQQAASATSSLARGRLARSALPVLYNHPPDRKCDRVRHQRSTPPDFLRDHPAVNAPVIEMMSHPDNPYVKLLVVFGRDDKDLLQRQRYRAEYSSVVPAWWSTIKPLLARANRGDAPNWVRTDARSLLAS